MWFFDYRNISKVEIILTSGFSYLFDTRKEITIIVREKAG